MLQKETCFLAKMRSDLCGGALEFQQHQRTGTFQDVEVEQERLLPVMSRAVKTGISYLS